MAQSSTRSIVVVANKWWEADPLVNAALHPKARPGSITDIEVVSHPVVRQACRQTPEPRIRFNMCDFAVEIWCVSDLMDPDADPSSTVEKARVLPQVFTYPHRQRAIDLVIAFGTAGFPPGFEVNGCVVIGTEVFVHNPYDRTGPDIWTDKRLDKLIPSSASELIGQLDRDYRFPAEGRFLLPPIAPAKPPRLLIGSDFHSLGIVNVTNYDDYIWADQQAIEAFREKAGKGRIGSIETTHGVIRFQSGAPFIYVSGITDNIGSFDLEVAPRPYAQNFAAAHNAAVALLWMMATLTRISAWALRA